MTTVARTRDLEWIHIFRSEFLLGILLKNMTSDVLIPVGCSVGFFIIILCNFAAIRTSGFILRSTLSVFSHISFTSLYIFLYFLAKAFESRRLALKRRWRRARTKLARLQLRACRPFRMTFGSFYDIDHNFMLVVAMFIIDQTTSLLIAFP